MTDDPLFLGCSTNGCCPPTSTKAFISVFPLFHISSVGLCILDTLNTQVVQRKIKRGVAVRNILMSARSLYVGSLCARAMTRLVQLLSKRGDQDWRAGLEDGQAARGCARWGCHWHVIGAEEESTEVTTCKLYNVKLRILGVGNWCTKCSQQLVPHPSLIIGDAEEMDYGTKTKSIEGEQNAFLWWRWCSWWCLKQSTPARAI